VAGSILHAPISPIRPISTTPWPVADGWLEASLRLTPERFAEGLGAWLNQRGKAKASRWCGSDSRLSANLAATF